MDVQISLHLLLIWNNFSALYISFTALSLNFSYRTYVLVLFLIKFQVIIAVVNKRY